jgi:protein TonB
MSERQMVDRLDAEIEALLTNNNWESPAGDPEVSKLLNVAAGLCTLPRAGFKAQLKADLMMQTVGADLKESTRVRVVQTNPQHERTPMADILPTLTRSGYGLYPVQRSSFMASLGAHTLVIALLVTSGIWAAQTLHPRTQVDSVVVTDLSSYVFPAAPDTSRGGGGGGDQDQNPASKGNPPRFDRTQIAPPAIIVRNEQPKLAAEPTVVGPPELSFPQTSQMGDPYSRISAASSNGPGTNSGIGTGDTGGVGPGRGPGVGKGWGGGFGGGPYVVGRGVSAPRVVYDPEPEYSDEARQQKYQGVVVLSVVVGEDGRARDVRVARSLGMGLDEKAQEAVRQWRFEPGRMNGQAVSVLVDVEVNFRLY